MLIYEVICLKLIHCVYLITFMYNICLHAHARPALSIRDNNTHDSTTPSRFTIGTFDLRRLSPAKRRQLSEVLGRLTAHRQLLSAGDEIAGWI